MVTTETVTDETGTWTQVWECDPPEEGTQFQVLEDEWSEDFTVRRITAWVEVDRP